MSKWNFARSNLARESANGSDINDVLPRYPPRNPPRDWTSTQPVRWSLGSERARIRAGGDVLVLASPGRPRAASYPCAHPPTDAPRRATGDTLDELRESVEEGIALVLARPGDKPPEVTLGELVPEPVATTELVCA
jgi:hypothetical protein